MKIFWKVLISILGLFLAEKFVPGVLVRIIPGKSIYFGIQFSSSWQMIVFLGLILGLLKSLLKPILNMISFPLKILTLGLSSFLLDLLFLWILDFIFPELKFLKFSSLLLTALIVGFLEISLK